MLIIFESEDKTGKTTLAKRLAEQLDIQYLKLNNISVNENESVDDSISISTHSQLETFTQLYERGMIKDAILDRFHISEYAYSHLFHRGYDSSYIRDIDNRLSKYNDVILIRCKTYYKMLKNRWKDEKLINIDKIRSIMELYNNFYRTTLLDTIEIDTSQHVDISMAVLLSELYKRGIYKDHLRQKRITHTQAMMNIAQTLAKRSPDISRQVGAILTENGFIVGAGYNGPPSGMKHDKVDIRKVRGYKSGEALDLSRAIHAEQNAIMQSGIRTRSDKFLELFVTSSPCIHCMRQLIQIGIDRIVFIEKYDHPLAWEMAEEAGVEMIQWNGE